MGDIIPFPAPEEEEDLEVPVCEDCEVQVVPLPNLILACPQCLATAGMWVPTMPGAAVTLEFPEDEWEGE